MAKVESFELDHNKVKAPYVRLAGTETHPSGAVIQKYDLRFLQPNHDSMPTAAVHTLEHLLAINIRDEIDGVIDISPMGCRTGFYMIVWGEQPISEIVSALETVLKKVATYEDVPAMTAEACGNYRDHSLISAKLFAQQVLDNKISHDPFERVFG